MPLTLPLPLSLSLGVDRPLVIFVSWKQIEVSKIWGFNYINEHNVHK